MANDDGDEIAAVIDGSWDGVTFSDESAFFSANWTDQHFGGGTTFGHIVERADLAISVSDLTSPAGVRIESSGGAGPATLSLCGFQVLFTAGKTANSTCGSLNLDVVSGPGDPVLPVTPGMSGDEVFLDGFEDL